MTRVSTPSETRAAIDIARAPHNYPGLSWMSLSDDQRAAALADARIAIRSLYEPDMFMLAAYMNALEQPADPKKEPWHEAKMRKRWRAMIDAASPPE